MSNSIAINDPITALLEKVQESIPAATQDQLTDILNTIETSAELILSAKTGKFQGFLKLVQDAQPGGLASVESVTPIVSATVQTPVSAPIVPDAAPVASEGGDRDWATFDPNQLDTLSYEDLESFSEWQDKEEKRVALLNKIQNKRASAISSTEEALKNQLLITETNRRVLQTKAQVEYATNQGAELDKLAVSIGTATMADQFVREKNALNELGQVGKETPTLGQVALLQARVIQRERMNQSNGIANSIAPMVKAIGPTSTEKEVVTIDA